MSVEVVIVVIIVLFGGLFLVLNQLNLEKDLNFNEKQKKAQTENVKVISKFKEEKIFKENDDIDFIKFRSLKKEEIAEKFNLKSDFCIFIKDSNGSTTKGVGSSNLNVDGILCK